MMDDHSIDSDVRITTTAMRPVRLEVTHVRCSGRFAFTGMQRLATPAYQHKCDTCGEFTYLDKTYPRIEHVPAAAESAGA